MCFPRLSLSKLKNFNHTFAALWDHLQQMATGDNVNDTMLHLVCAALQLQTSLLIATALQEQQQLVDNTLRTMLANMPAKQFLELGVDHEQFILDDFFKCAADEVVNATPCRTFANIITTSQPIGNCFTLFHRSYKKVSTMAQIASGYSQSPVLKGATNEPVTIEISERTFSPNEVVRIKVNFTGADYTTLNEPVMGSIIVHDSSVAPAVRLKMLEITPGHYYDFFLTKVCRFALQHANRNRFRRLRICCRHRTSLTA